MKKTSLFLFIIVGLGAITSWSFTATKPIDEEDIATLRKLYSSGDYNQWPKPSIDESVRATFKDIGPLGDVPYPADNVPNEDKKNLGKILFFDPRLSLSNQIACASCHEPQLGWGDGKRVANGHDRQTGTRNAMTLLNVAFYDKLFWDGRANSLEHQARFPVQDHVEMNIDLNVMEKKVQSFKGYESLFEKAFGSKEINLEKIFKAIASFERTIVSPPSRFDLFVKGKPELLKDEEVLGLHVFRTKARCINCHNTPLFSDNQFHNDGQTMFGTVNEDLGLYHVTKKPSDVGKFRTPSLREAANTGPWMHHGNFPTMKDVIFFYDKGNPAPIQKKYVGTRDSLLPTTDPILKKLDLTPKEIDGLVAFMQAITTTPRRINPPVNFPQ